MMVLAKAFTPHTKVTQNNEETVALEITPPVM